MGEDIHNKAYAKSKVVDKYVQSSELIVDQSFSDSMFRDLVPGRSYKLFSCFGSRRADFKTLGCLHDGIPDFVKEQFPTEYANVTDKGWNHYGFCWATIRELKVSIKTYIEKLKDPMLYYDNCEDDEYERDIYADIEENKESREAWQEDANVLSDQLIEILKTLDEMKHLHDEFEMDKLIDFDETIYLFWFDC